MSDFKSSSRPPDAELVLFCDRLTVDSSWSSWSTKAHAEIQRDLIASRVFEGEPLTIDRFEIEKLVGAGSSAAVYAARDPLLDRRVAIKVLGDARAQQVNVVAERWIREARALAHLSHRNVVAIYDVGQWKGRPFIAMELIEGTTLALWLAAKRRSVAEVVDVFREAGCGLAAAHAAGHVHRDFKPANVLVARDGRVVVSDFGLVGDAAQDGPTAHAHGTGSHESEARARTRDPVGTPAYVAPEQRAGAPAHPSADVYSFAVSLIEALLGYRPTESTTMWQQALRSRVSRPLFRAVCGAMAADPAQRAQSLAPLLDALAPPRRAVHRRVAGMLASGGVAMLVAVGLLGSSWRRAWNDPPKVVVRLSPSLLPTEIDKEVQSLLATPPERRGRGWDERARTVLMLPIPTRVPCNWAAPPQVIWLVGDQVLALDSRDHLATCAIRTGIVTAIADEVRCFRLVDDAAIRVVPRNGDAVVYQHDDEGWQARPLAESFAISNAAIDRDWDRHCRIPFVLDPVKQGDAEIRMAGDRKISRKRDGSLWLQVGDEPARFIAAQTIAYQLDRGLCHALVVTSTRAQVFDLVTIGVIADTPSPPDALSAISRDGSAAVMFGSKHMMWWRRGQLQWQSRPIDTPAGKPMLSPNADRVLSVAFGALDVRELGSGRRYALAGAQIQDARFLDDDQVVAVDFSGGVWRWSLARLRSWILADHAGHTGETWMWGFAMCKRAGSVLTATQRKDRPILVSSPSGEQQRELVQTPDTQIYGLSCEGDRVLAGTRDGRILEWDRPSGRTLSEHDAGAAAWIWTIATASPAGGLRTDLLGTGSTREKRVGGRVMMMRDGAVTEVFSARFNGGEYGISEIAVSSNGRRAAAGASSGELAVIDVVGATARAINAHRGASRRVRFADSDRVIVSGGDDGYLRIWRVDDLVLQNEINVGHGQIYDLDVHGTLAIVATADGHVGAWNLSMQELVHTYRADGALAATSKFDASGEWIVSGDYEGRVCLHHADQQGCYAALIGHEAAPGVRHGLFLDDGQIITGSDDGTIRQWRPPYRAPSSELACELQQYRFATGPIASPCHGDSR